MEKKAILRGELANLTWSVEQRGTESRLIRHVERENVVKVFPLIRLHLADPPPLLRGKEQGARSRRIALAVGILLPLAPCSLPPFTGELEGGFFSPSFKGRIRA